MKECKFSNNSLLLTGSIPCKIKICFICKYQREWNKRINQALKIWNNEREKV